MAAATPTTHDAIIKDLFPWEEVVKAMYENNPLYAMVKKNYAAYGKNWHLPIRIAHTMGRSRTFSNAKANKKGSNVVEMQITVTQDYSLYSVDGKLAAQTANSKGAFVEAFQFELEAAMDAMNRSFGIGVYKNHGGAMGQIGTVSTTRITLSNINDVVNFEVGDVLQFATTDGTSGAVHSGGATGVISAIDRDNGYLDSASNWSAQVASIANSDYIFKDGDFGQAMRGLDAWIPSTVSATAFFGLDRTTDAVRLAGNRVSVTGLNPEEQLQKACQVGVRNGAKPTHCFMNDLNFLDLVLSLGSRVRYADTKTEVGVGFTGVKVHTGVSEMEVYSDANCPYNTAYLLTLSDWEIAGPGKFPFIDAEDGNKILREDSADSYEGRIKAYMQMVCKKPHRQIRATLG